MIASHHLDPQKLYIAGGPGGNSIDPAIHDWIAKSLRLKWTCEFLRYSNVDDVVKLFRQEDFAGGIVTMPHKRTIIQALDSIDDYVREIGACNFVIRKANGQLHGTNTDWLGIKNAIEAEMRDSLPSIEDTALVYGAGGASRAAIYALVAGLGCKTIYIVNRDEEEVAELIKDVQDYTETAKPHLLHIRTVDQAAVLLSPRYIICTIPDFEPKSPTELACRAILSYFLGCGRSQQNLILDMCYHPPMTRNLKAAQEESWKVIPGFLVIAHQFAPQWHMWSGMDIDAQAVFTICNELVKGQYIQVSY